MNRRRMVLGIGVLAMVAAVSIAWLASQTRITKENFDLIDYGMTWADVQAMLGPPDKCVLPEQIEDRLYPDAPGRIARWYGQSYIIDVQFNDEEWKVIGKQDHLLNSSLLAKLRRWLGW